MRSAKYGFSLLEVVISLALLSTLIAGALVSHGRATRQVATARSKLNAVDAAEQLLQQWILLENTNVPLNQTGVCGEEDQFKWRTGTPIQIRSTVGKIKLEIFDSRLERNEAVVSVWVATVLTQN